MKALIAIPLVCLVAALATSASAYDRSPVTVPGLHPDDWTQTITNAEWQLHKRYSGIKNTYCVGVIMQGFASDSAVVYGLSRYWDKLLCAGALRRRTGIFSLIFDQKGSEGWTIYRLRGASIAELYG
jgi:hypothetical protein